MPRPYERVEPVGATHASPLPVRVSLGPSPSQCLPHTVRENRCERWGCKGIKGLDEASGRFGNERVWQWHAAI